MHTHVAGTLCRHLARGRFKISDWLLDFTNVEVKRMMKHQGRHQKAEEAMSEALKSHRGLGP